MNLFEKFLEILDVLHKEGVEYILIGGFAVVLYGLPRFTQDIDIFVKPKEDNIKKLKRVLISIFNDKSIEEITLKELEKYPVIRYGTPEGFNLDIISKIGSKFSYDDLQYRIIEIEGRQLRIATPESLYRLKENTVRPIDKSDAVFLKELIKRKKKK